MFTLLRLPQQQIQAAKAQKSPEENSAAAGVGKAGRQH